MTASIGALRTRIRLEKPAPDPDSGVAWADVGAIWTRMTKDAEGPRSIRVELRMRRDVRAGWRVALGDRRFRIIHIRDGDDRGARLFLDCEEEIS